MAKTKITMFLDQDLIEWLDHNRDEETSRSAYLRILIRKDMKTKSRKKVQRSVQIDDFYNTSSFPPQFVPDDLKDYADLLIEWWAVRYKNKGTCSKSVFDRIIKKLRSFPTQDRKQALENAIAGGWKDLFPLKQSFKPEEPQHQPKIFKPEPMPPTLAELGKTAKEMMEGNQ